MNKIYDKLLLLLAVLALLGGIAVFVLKSGSAPDGQTAPLQPSGNPYEAIPVPESTSTEAAWPVPGEQSSGWVYDVFTPPKIFIDENGQFSAEGWAPPPPPKPFGVYLVEIVRKPYRIQVEGYIEEDLSDASKSLLLLFDEEAQTQIRIRPGETHVDADFEVLGFSIVRKIDPATSTVEKSATVTILDKRSGEEVQLVHGERLFDSGVTVVIASEDDPTSLIELTEEGTTFETVSGQYELQQINLEENTVTVEKQATEEDEAEARTLSPQSGPPAAAAPASAPS